MIANEICGMLSDSVTNILFKMPQSMLEKIQEVRLRVNRPLAITADGVTLYPNKGGSCSSIALEFSYIVTQADISNTLDKLCEHSLYSFENQIHRGYITLKNGHRAGICGNFYDGDRISVREVTSINIRFARQLNGCSKPIFDLIGRSLSNTLIIGAPGTGKTTMLRDMAREYSIANIRVCIADERGEIAAMRSGISSFDLGPSCDVITDADKSFAINTFVKYFNPQLIVFDELADNAAEIEKCMQCGVSMLTSLHADSIRSAVKRMSVLGVDSSAFDNMILLDREHMGKVSDAVLRSEEPLCGQ